jgi:diguanylate cyclase (GGDEF)-like protein/PAS domain S-box-containing protein
VPRVDRDRESLLRQIAPLAAVGLPFFALLFLFVVNDRAWDSRARELEQRATTLERELLPRPAQVAAPLDDARKIVRPAHRLGPFSPLGWAALIAFGLVFSLALRWRFRHRFTADARYRAIIDQSNDGIVAVDAGTHRVLFTNPAFRARLGYTIEDAKRLTLTELFADDGVTPETLFARLRDADSGTVFNLQQRCKSGALLDAEVRCNALDINGRRVLAFVARDISLRRKAEQQLIENQQRLDRLAHHDQLTGLPNRHHLAAFLPDAIAAARASGTMLGVVFLDLDRFKHINDTRGHETGDKLLHEVAQRLRACVRDSDVVVRMGGDEFVFVFRHVKSFDEVTLGAARILETLSSPIVVDGHSLQTSGSVGVSMFPRDGADMVELLKHSDMAMYQAKDRGRNNVQLFSPILNRRLKRRVAVEASLREALRLKQLDVHYQPFVDLLTRKVVGLEALIRWHHPERGMIPADQFIPVAEETGLVVPLGNFVLRRTLQNMSSWRAAGVTLVPVSLNVASSQLQRGDLQETISTLLATHGLGPELLQLEMTERAVFDSGPTQPGERGQDTIARLRDLGIKIAIDDFGTGYSSLSYLKHWRVDALKIDRSFIRDLVTDASDLAIVSAIVAMARQLRITVIAEGIEGYQQAELLSRLGCALGQGYLFARPMPADECLALLRVKVVGRRGDEVEDMLATLSARG